MAAIETDPYNLDTDKAFEDEEMHKFVNSQNTTGLNMSVVMYMVAGLEFFKDKSMEKARETGYEIAQLGRYGIDHKSKERYSLSTVPGQAFSGWKHPRLDVCFLVDF